MEKEINKWYEEQVNNIAEAENKNTRLETNVLTNDFEESKETLNKIQTKVDDYTEIQTNNKSKLISNQNNGKLKTINKDETFEEVTEKQNEIKDVTSKKVIFSGNIGLAIKGAKIINNTANRFVTTSKRLNTTTNESGIKSFEKSSSRIMTKPVKKIAKKYTSKATNVVRKTGIKATKKVVKKTTNIVVKATKSTMKIVAGTVKLLTSMIPSIAPVIIIIVIIAAIGKFFNFKTTKEADSINFEDISSMIIEIEDEKLQGIYNEFLKNMGKPYLMDHSNLKYDECMDYYDCSSFVIHCLAHSEIITIPNTRSKRTL